MFTGKIQKTISVLLVIMILTAVFAVLPATTALASETGALRREDDQMRGIWLSCFDYEALGLTIAEDEEVYRENADRFLEEAQKYGINTVFLHARAFDDAFWRTRSFKASGYVGGDGSLTAWEAYKEYDPFGVFLEEAHMYGMEVHAWLNPYRITQEYYYDPGDPASTRRILTAVKELLTYRSGGKKIDGIHLDDYFYHAKKGYYRIQKSRGAYEVPDPEKERLTDGEYDALTPAGKRENVNRMVRAVYRTAKASGRTFGISPAGNYDNDMNAGADIDTWLSEEGYVDYIIPQIYWTNQWGDGDTAMFSNRFDQFLAKRKNSAKFYAGLALYRAGGSEDAGDPGWRLKNTNLEEQIAELESKGADGYVYFSAQYLFRNCASEELANIQKQ